MQPENLQGRRDFGELEKFDKHFIKKHEKKGSAG